jgi:hypothetical protein
MMPCIRRHISDKESAMTCSLYDALVPTYLQIVRGTQGWLGKAETFATEQGRSEAEIMGAVLAPDMFPFNRQVRGSAMHCHGGLAGAQAGLFKPDMTPAPTTFTGLQARVAEAIAYLERLVPEDVNDLVGKPMMFEIGERKMAFAADNFLLSFSQPNFFFHTTTAYAILRLLGVPLGKMDCLGRLRLAV